MYYYLRGIIQEQLENSIIIEVNGIGYQVLVSKSEDFPLSVEMVVYVNYIVREDEQYLVGFTSREEKTFFNQLIQVKGIGPKTALNALRGISYQEFIECIENEDVKRLKKLDGIGAKAASQIILDLKGSLVGANSSKTLSNNEKEAIEALKSLMFKSKDIEDCLSRLDTRKMTTEQIITSVLQMIRK